MAGGWDLPLPRDGEAEAGSGARISGGESHPVLALSLSALSLLPLVQAFGAQAAQVSGKEG